MRVFFFGCLNFVGHQPYQWRPGRTPVAIRYLELAEALGAAPIDGAFTPAMRTEQGAATLLRVNGFTVLAWHDYTVDTRPGSNSLLAVEMAGVSLAVMLEILAERFPDVSRRQPIAPFVV